MGHPNLQERYPSIDRARISRRAFVGSAAAAAVATATSRVAVGQQGAAEQPAPANTVLVYPPNGTRTASPYTEISFRGITEDDLGPVMVHGTESGGQSGTMAPHADGNGVSYLPDGRFEPGERVTVSAAVPLGPEGADTISFAVVQPAPVIEAPVHEPDDERDFPVQQFKSRPDLTPPVLDVTTPAGDTAPGFAFIAAKVRHGQSGNIIVDNSGEIVWYHPPEVEDYVYHDFRVQEYQGEPVLTFSEAVWPSGFGRGHFVICDSTYQRVAEVRAGNGYTDGGDIHEFHLTPRGTAYLIIFHGVNWDVSPVGGSMYDSVFDCITQEIEIETGRVLYEWHALDHIGLDESHANAASERDEPYDFFHQNSVDEDADGNLIISARHTDGIYKIDRRTNEVIWRLGGAKTDFTMGDGTDFHWQHDARLHGSDQLSLFDNHTVDTDAEGEHSRGMILQLDEDAMTASLMLQYVHPDELISRSQGNMEILPNGNVFVGWGSQPVFSEFSPNGSLVFDCRLPQGSNSYRAYRAEWGGQPVDPPAVAIEPEAAGGMTVYASWNGATSLAGWRVLAGQSTDALEEVATGERTGFETAITVATAAPFVVVTAVDEAGTVLGTSEVIQPPAI